MTVHDFLQRFGVILLDMNSTFMFGEDRFGEDQDYAATYRNLGGAALAADQVQNFVTACVEHLTKLGREPARFNDFPSVKEALVEVAGPFVLDPAESDRLADVIALHELGEVPNTHARALHKLAKNHRLGLVTYIWSEKTRWLCAFEAVGIKALFEVITWSADGSSIKPAPALFERAIAAFDVPRARIVYIGDHPVRDIEGANAVGLATVWIDDGSRTRPKVEPDLVVNSLTELV